MQDESERPLELLIIRGIGSRKSAHSHNDAQSWFQRAGSDR